MSNKYYREWLENQKKSGEIISDINSHVNAKHNSNKAILSRTIDKIKNEEKAKQIFSLGNNINTSKYNNNHQIYQLGQSVFISQPTIISSQQVLVTTQPVLVTSQGVIMNSNGMTYLVRR